MTGIRTYLYVALPALCLLAAYSCRKDAPAPVYPEPENIGPLEFPDEAVDMGDKLEWAPCNLGADSFSAPGNYYVWGGTDPVSEPVTEAGYWDIDKTTGMYSKYQVGDFLYDEDEPVIINMGGKWRMPTYDEAAKLVKNSEWKYVVCAGAVGYLATSKNNGSQLFFPAAGYWADGGLVNKDFAVHVWTSDGSFEYTAFACCLSMSPVIKPCVGDAHKYLAMPVRGVRKISK